MKLIKSVAMKANNVFNIYAMKCIQGIGMSSLRVGPHVLCTLLTIGLNGTLCVHAQNNAGIGTSSPDPSALLDLSATDMGLLIPRMTMAKRDAIVAPATGLLVFQTDNTPGFYYYDGSAWVSFAGSGSSGYSIGDFAQGGIVFWVDETGQHGLVCDKSDLPGFTRWFAGSYTSTMAFGRGPFSGEANTTIIIANQGFGDGATYAARICNELQITEGGKTYGDWYLPSKDELHQMYVNRATINATAVANSGSSFVSSIYWSSTEANGLDAWLQDFSSGSQSFFDKFLEVYVRAIRAF